MRNCIYRGPFNDLLQELSNDYDFRYLLNLKHPKKRMKEVELVLRFAAFYHSTYLNYKPSMRKFLNTEIEKYQFINDKDKDELKFAIKNAVTIIKSLLDKNEFKRFYKCNNKNPNEYWEQQRFNASFYDILMYSMFKADKNIVYQNLDSIREALIYLMTSDEEFIKSIEISSSVRGDIFISSNY